MWFKHYTYSCEGWTIRMFLYIPSTIYYVDYLYTDIFNILLGSSAVQ